MIALYIILAILGFFFLLFSIPVHVVARVNGSDIGVWIRFLFVRIPIFPVKKRKKKGKEKPKKQKQKKSDKKKTDEKAGEKKPKPKRDILGLIKLLLKIVAAVLRKFPKHFGVTVHAYEISIATGDAAKTAVTYGAVVGLSEHLFRALKKATRFRIKRKAPVNVYTDFVGTKTRVNICLDINLTINDVLSFALAAGFAFAKYKMFGPKPAPTGDEGEEKKEETKASDPSDMPETDIEEEDASLTPTSEYKEVIIKKIPDKRQKG